MTDEIYLKNSLTVNNSIITLGDTDDSGKGRHFKSRFIQPGLAGYPGQYGNALIKKENLDKFVYTLRNKPVIINHKDEIEEKDKVGEVFNVWFNPDDGWYWCDGIITDVTAQNLIQDKGWSVSCSYNFTSYNNDGGTENNVPYDIEFLDGEFMHLAIVDKPRYEGANIVMNAKDKEGEGEWITVKGNHILVKEGQTKEEAVKEFINKQQDKSEGKSSDKKEAKTEGFDNIKNRNNKEWKDVSDKGKNSYNTLTTSLLSKKKMPDALVSGFMDNIIKEDLDGMVVSWVKEHVKDTPERAAALKDFDEKSKNKDSEGAWQAWQNLYDVIKGKSKDVKKSDENPNKAKFEKEYTTIEGMIKRRNLEPRKEEALLEQLEDYKREFDKNLEPHEEDALLEDLNDFKMDIYKNVNARNSKGDLMMSVLNELESFVKGVIRNANDEDEKEIKNEKVDKRELIEEVGGMLKGKIDDEIIKTIIKKMEEASYDESEAGSADNKKVKNESEEEKEDKKAENKKVKNEESEDDKEKAEELKKDEKEDVENKCNNSKTDFFDKMNKIYNSSLTPSKSETEYTSRADRLKAGEEYFKV